MRNPQLSQDRSRGDWQVSELSRLTARKQFFEAGLKREQIAASVPCSYNTVRSILKDGPLTLAERKRLKELEDAPAPDPSAGRADTKPEGSTLQHNTGGEAA